MSGVQTKEYLLVSGRVLDIYATEIMYCVMIVGIHQQSINPTAAMSLYYDISTHKYSQVRNMLDGE